MTHVTHRVRVSLCSHQPYAKTSVISGVSERVLRMEAPQLWDKISCRLKAALGSPNKG